jgi:hypothetical protein
MKWAGHVARIGEKRNGYRLLVGKPEGKRPLGRPRRGWVANIRINLGETGWGGVDWIGLAQDRNRWRAILNSVLNLRGSIKCSETIDWPNIWCPLKQCSAPYSQLLSSAFLINLHV